MDFAICSNKPQTNGRGHKSKVFIANMNFIVYRDRNVFDSWYDCKSLGETVE